MANFPVHVLLWFAIAIGAAGMAVPHRAAAQQQVDPAVAVQEKFNQLYAAGRYAEAVPLAEQLVELSRSRFGAQSGGHGSALYQLGNLLIGISRYGAAEGYLRQALAIFNSDQGFTPQRLQTEVMLATTLVYQSKLDEGLPLMHRSTLAFEAAFGLHDKRTITALNNLAQTLQVSGRAAEAEPVYRKLIAGLDPTGTDNLTDLGVLHANLAAVLAQAGKRDDAVAEMRRSVELLRKVGNTDHVFLATALNNLGKLEHDAGNFAAAEALYKEGLASTERAGGRNSDGYGVGLMNLAVLQRDLGKAAEAETSTRQALSIFEAVLGSHHPKTGAVQNSLAVLLAARSAWSEALALYERATESAVRNARAIGSEDGRLAASVYGLNPGDFPAHMRAIYNVAPDDPQRREQAFKLLQRSLNSRAAAALSRMAARAATPGSALAGLIREQQDLLRARAANDQALVAALGAVDNKSQLDRARADMERIEAALARTATRLKDEFPQYQALDGTEPVALADIQRALKPHEALVAFVEVEASPSMPGEMHAWVVTPQTALWRRLDVKDRPPEWRVPTLRCGLDAAAWRTDIDRETCARLTGIARSEDDERSGRPLPYNVARAHETYTELFAPLEPALRMPDGGWRDLLVVTSGSLSTIPLSALVTAPPPFEIPASFEDYRRVEWLGKRQPITVLPAISSLVALRRVAKPSAAAKAMIGFGNPLLDGRGQADQARAQEARDKQRCLPAAVERLALAGTIAPRGRVGPVIARGRLANVAQIREAAPLPETADEVCEIARALDADLGEMRLGGRATVRELKALNASGALANYHIVHFATHGTLAGEMSEASEPGLILTPPDKATDDDDGYLSASEIAALRLDADWVILSACNTAGADGGSAGADALSGLARAFFYAGARALLVSHWGVDSDATVKLITTTVGAISRDPRVGRAEALRRAMVAMIDTGKTHQAHPAYWAPFIVVGEGAAAQ
jgi:CHAT domain-containing protein